MLRKLYIFMISHRNENFGKSTKERCNRVKRFTIVAHRAIASKWQSKRSNMLKIFTKIHARHFVRLVSLSTQSKLNEKITFWTMNRGSQLNGLGHWSFATVTCIFIFMPVVKCFVIREWMGRTSFASLYCLEGTLIQAHCATITTVSCYYIKSNRYACHTDCRCFRCFMQ